MKIFIKTSMIILLALSFASCSELSNWDKPEDLAIVEDFKSVEINNEYSIRIPNYMKETDILNDEASLQFQNLLKTTFIIIIDESKEEFVDVFREYGLYYDSISILQNYRDVQLNSFMENVNIIDVSEPKPLTINGLSAEIVEMDCDLDDIKISYVIAYVEGKDKLYLIMAWTTLDKKEKYLNTFLQEIKSFKEI